MYRDVQATPPAAATGEGRVSDLLLPSVPGLLVLGPLLSVAVILWMRRRTRTRNRRLAGEESMTEMETALHIPDFTHGVTDEERSRGFSSRCVRCRRLLPSGMELLGSRCPGQAE